MLRVAGGAFLTAPTLDTSGWILPAGTAMTIPEVTPEDDLLHPASDHWWETETAWFSFNVPELQMRIGNFGIVVDRPPISGRGFSQLADFLKHMAVLNPDRRVLRPTL